MRRTNIWLSNCRWQHKIIAVTGHTHTHARRNTYSGGPMISQKRKECLIHLYSWLVFELPLSPKKSIKMKIWHMAHKQIGKIENLSDL